MLQLNWFKLPYNEQGLALLGDLKIVRPVLLPNRITDDEIKNKKPNRYSSAGTEDAMLLKMMLQGHAPITPNPLLYAYPIFSVIYNVGLVVVAGCVLWVGQGRLLGRLASVRWVCVPDHVPDLQRWLVRVVVSFALVV